MGELDPSDTFEEKDNVDMKKKKLFVPFQANESLQDEHVSVECDDDGDFAAVSKPTSRPVLSKHRLVPSAFLRDFQSHTTSTLSRRSWRR